MKNIKKLLTALFCLTLSIGMVACATTDESSLQGSSVGESSVVETPESSSSTQEPEEPESSSSTQEPEEPESSSSAQEPEEPEEPEKTTYKVTFKQEGQEDKVFDVKEGEALTDVPTPVGKTGYSVVWDVTDFSNVTGNITVNVVVTPMEYVITYDANGGEAVESQSVTFDAEYTLASTSRDNHEFTGWYVVGADGNATETKLEDGVWTTAENVTVVAGWDFIDGEYAMRYTFNVGGEEASFITKKAYDAGSKVSFKYYIPEGTVAQWWGVGYTEDANSIDYYAAANNGIGKVLGAWTTHTFKLPESGGPYYVYISSEVGNWKLDGDNAYVFIDDFTVGSETEDFNKSMDEWALTVRNAKAVKISEKDEGYVEPVVEEENFGAKLLIDSLSSTASTPSFITKETYKGGGTVTFDYYMTGNTINKWWAFFWTNSNTVASIYAHVENNKENNDGLELPVVQDSWQTTTVSIPEGDWYFYISGAKGEWNGGHVIIDNVVIKDADGNVLATETFDKLTTEEAGDDYGIFLDNRNGSNAAAITLVEGKPETAQGDTMLAFNEASIGGNERIAMITEKAYTGVTEISFKAMWAPTATQTTDWGLSYTTDPTKFSYDHSNLAAVNCYSPKLGILKKDVNVIYQYKLTIADGTWTMYINDEYLTSGSYTDGANYFYFVINPKGGTDTAFYMDDFTITYADGTVTDTFDNSESSLFIESETVIGAGYGSSGMSFVESTFENE